MHTIQILFHSFIYMLYNLNLIDYLNKLLFLSMFNIIMLYFYHFFLKKNNFLCYKYCYSYIIL